MARGATRRSVQSGVETVSSPHVPTAETILALLRNTLMTGPAHRQLASAMANSEKFLQKVVEIAAGQGEDDAGKQPPLPSVDVRIIQVLSRLTPEQLERYAVTGEIDARLLRGGNGDGETRR